jgi:hypothetical protein
LAFFIVTAMKTPNLTKCSTCHVPVINFFINGDFLVENADNFGVEGDFQPWM